MECSSLAKMTCMILHDLVSIWQDVLARLSHARILPSFMQDFDNVRQEIAKTSYINLAKFLARFWQDHAR